MRSILFLSLILPGIVVADHSMLDVLTDNNTAIEFVEPPTVDFNVGLGDSDGEETQTINVGRKKDGKHRPEAKRPPLVSKPEPTLKIDEQAKQQEPETKKFITNVKYDGREGWLTTEVDGNGRTVSATFSSNYGSEGEKVSTQFMGPNGEGNFNVDLQKKVALGQMSGTLGGKQITQVSSPGSGGGSGGGC